MSYCEKKRFVRLFIAFCSFICSGILLVGAEIQCYQCTSTFLDTNGKPIAGKENPNCPVDGTVKSDATYSEFCGEKCLMRTSLRNAGVVIRSCSAQIPLPQPLPENGCYSHQGDIHCLCNTNYCNGQAMNELLRNRTLKDLKSLARAASEEFEKNNKGNAGDKKDGPHQCYICQSSYQGKMNENCPGDHHINAGPTIYRSNCSGPCYVKTDVRYSGIVFRGCSDIVYSFPKPTPKDGCYKYYVDVWCICRGHLCNTKPLGKAQNKELDYMVGIKSKGSRHLMMMSFVLMTAGAAILSTESTSIDGEWRTKSCV